VEQRRSLGASTSFVPALLGVPLAEGHTAHASYEDANAFATKIHLEVYNDFLVQVLAAPTYLGIKPASERFAGAINSMTAEG